MKTVPTTCAGLRVIDHRDPPGGEWEGFDSRARSAALDSEIGRPHYCPLSLSGRDMRDDSEARGFLSRVAREARANPDALALLVDNFAVSIVARDRSCGWARW